MWKPRSVLVNKKHTPLCMGRILQRSLTQKDSKAPEQPPQKSGTTHGLAARWRWGLHSLLEIWGHLTDFKYFRTFVWGGGGEYLSVQKGKYLRCTASEEVYERVMDIKLKIIAWMGGCITVVGANVALRRPEALYHEKAPPRNRLWLLPHY